MVAGRRPAGGARRSPGRSCTMDGMLIPSVQRIRTWLGAAAVAAVLTSLATGIAARAQVDANERRMREISEEIREKEEAR